MTTLVTTPQLQDDSIAPVIQSKVEATIDELIASLPDINTLTSSERRGIIARYSAVLEGNFIYWMTAALLAIQSEEAKPIILDNLHEEVRDAHPAMLRRFALAAHAYPTDKDAMAVDEDLTKVRVFLGRLSGVQSLVTMAFFEGFIQKFMGYLAELAVAEKSSDMEYTDVHGVCDIAHTQGLFTALGTEVVINPLEQGADPLEGVHLLNNLIQTIVFNRK
jgi:hypothetical protein